MTKRKKHIFKDEQLLQEMLVLRKQGLSSQFLAKKYKVDHTTILYQCKLHNVYPERIIRINKEREIFPLQKTEKLPEKKIEQHKYAHLIFEPMNQGKMYRQYLKTAH